MTVDPRFERSVRRWLRAYPRRWRTARADEVVGVLADLAAPGETRLGARAALGLLAAGLATRVRTGPPVHERIGYLLGLRVSARYVDWAVDDLARPVPAARLVVRVGWCAMVSAGALVAGVSGGDWEPVAWMGALALVSFVAPDRRWVRAEAIRQLVPRPGDRGSTGWVEGCVPRERLAARPFVSMLAAGASWLVAAGAAAWLAAPRPAPARAAPAIPAAVALAVGLAVAALSVRRWRRRLTVRRGQPDRAVLPAGGRHAATAVALAAYGTAWLAGEATGRHPPVVAGVLVVVGPLVLPALLAAVLVVRRLGPGGGPVAVAGDRAAGTAVDPTAALAAVDLARVAATGRPPVPDRRVLAAVRAGSPDAGYGLLPLPVAVPRDPGGAVPA